ncbi:Ubiquitin hydrolase [Echinococcus granulosus]|uniref:Ubiquitin hydrolase n=1 Tax=Echinococcus granulosus TaxID=6210 RepID=W6UBK4_ECHGR|nr:Ubiquitin hydrolase [Echinococcus granulosus]EUB55822.1 Ubiquitin hydrolase [Echinococcus granulosus]
MDHCSISMRVSPTSSTANLATKHYYVPCFVRRPECVFAFAALDDKSGLLICLRTFLGVGLDFVDEYVSRIGNSVILQNKIVEIFRAKGHKCDLMTNLWMNLTDGTICCCRSFWDCSRGKYHAIKHCERTKYPLTVKLGTITPNASCRYFVLRQRKNGRCVMEMEVEANVRVGEWLTLQDADRTLTPLHGPGVIVSVNLGNTSYINSAVEVTKTFIYYYCLVLDPALKRVLMATEAFRGRYALALPSYVEAAMDAVAHNGSATAVVESFGLQMSKLGQVLWFGVYSIPPVGIGEMKGGEVVRKQPDIRPRMFRPVMGRTNAEFASKQQQDVQERKTKPIFSQTTCLIILLNHSDSFHLPARHSNRPSSIHPSTNSSLQSTDPPPNQSTIHPYVTCLPFFLPSILSTIPSNCMSVSKCPWH